MQSNIFYLVLVISICFLSCGDDLNIKNPNEPTVPINNPTNYNPDVDFPEPGASLVTSISGVVTDLVGDGLVDAIVTCVSCEDRPTTTTDEKGGFSFIKVKNEGAEAYLSVSSRNKFDGYRRFPVLADKQNYTSFMLRDKVMQASIDAQSGGTTKLSSGAEMILPSNGIINAQGQKYTGDVDVYFSWIDPSSEELAETMMGDLSGIGTDGELVGLSTFGMLQVELESADGSALNLAEGSTAELLFPVPSELLGMAPQEIPLWSYDEVHGYWVEEGSAKLTDGNYVGTVSHFSTWNVDAKVDPINVSGEIRLVSRGTEVGLSFFELRLSGESFNSVGGWLCDDGSFTFNNVPAGETLTIEITDYCGTVIETLVVGPFAESTVIDPIIISEATQLNEVLISGNATDCDGNALANGKVSVFIGDRPFSFPVEAQGDFLFAIMLCSGADANLQIINLDDFSTSADILITSQNENFTLTDIALCQENEEYFYYEWLDSLSQNTWEPYLMTEPDLVWYTKQDDLFLFQFISAPNSDVSTIGFSKTLILNQMITGNPGDGILIPDGNGGYESLITGQDFEFYFSDIGALNADGNPSYIQGTFQTIIFGSASGEPDFKGSFKLKYQ